MIIGIDPSFTRTGLCFIEGKTVKFKSVSCTVKKVYNLAVLLPEAKKFSKEIVQVILENVSDSTKVKLIGQEYPVMATRPGGILSVLMTYIYQEIKEKFPDAEYYLIPSMAINSFTGVREVNKSKKPLLLKYVSTAVKTSDFNHDEASAFVLAVIANRISKKQYPNTFIKL